MNKNLTQVKRSCHNSIYLTNKEMIFNVDNIYLAIEVGIVSGTSSTGTNQIIKKIFKQGGKENE